MISNDRKLFSLFVSQLFPAFLLLPVCLFLIYMNFFIRFTSTNQPIDSNAATSRERSTMSAQSSIDFISTASKTETPWHISWRRSRGQSHDQEKLTSSWRRKDSRQAMKSSCLRFACESCGANRCSVRLVKRWPIPTRSRACAYIIADELNEIY